MRSICMVLCLFLIFVFHPSIGLSASPSKSSDKITPLDEDSLKANALKRLVTTIKQQNPSAVGMEKITTGNIVIEQKEHIRFSNTDLWMVKLTFDALPMMKQDDARTVSMVMTVDSTGTYQFTDVSRVDTSENLFANARREIDKINMPDNLGDLLYKGTGKAKAIFVSDPYCPFCRNEYDYLKQNLDKFSEIRILHMPMPNLHPSSPFTSAVLAYAKEKVSQEMYVKITDFAYSKLNEEVKPKTVNNTPVPATIEQEQAILKKFTDEFPDLVKGQQQDTLFYYIKGKYVAVVNESVTNFSRLIQVRGTPNTIIDGYVVRGFNKTELEAILSKK